MGFLRNILYGGLTALALSTASPKAEASPLDMRPKTEQRVKAKSPPKVKLKKKKKLNLFPKTIINPPLKHPAFSFPRPKQEGRLVLNPMIHVGSSIGSTTKLDYIIPDGIDLKMDGKLWFNQYSFDIRNENFIDKVIYYGGQELQLPTTPLDTAARDILLMPDLRDEVVSGLTIYQWYNMFRMFYSKLDSSFNGRIFKTRGKLSAETDSHSEVFSTHYFNRGGTLIRYDHGIRYGILARGSINASAMFEFGDGIRLGINELEKYFGSRFFLDFKYNVLADLRATETHQFGQKIKHGWEGMGLNYEEFATSRMAQYLRIDASATMDELLNGHIVEMLYKDVHSRNIEDGFSYLLYYFRTQDFDKFWYYMMLGGSLKDYHYDTKTKNRVDSINIDLSTNFNQETDLVENERIGNRIDYRFNYALLGGISLGSHFHPYFGLTNYPYQKHIGGFVLTAPRFVSNFRIEHNHLLKNGIKPTFEFFIPLDYKGDYTTPLAQYFKESTISRISPFASRSSVIENSKRRAYSRLHGLFLNGELSDTAAQLSFLLNNGKKGFMELGANVLFTGENTTLFTRVGYGNLGVMLGYGRRLDKDKAMNGHNVLLGLVGDFGRVYGIIKGNLWFKRDIGYEYTPYGYIRPKNEKKFEIILGGRF